MSDRVPECEGCAELRETITDLRVNYAVLNEKVDRNDKRLGSIFSAGWWAVVGIVGIVGTAVINWIMAGGLT